MYQFINLQVNKQVLPLFSFLKDNPARTIAKDNHVMITYYQPQNFHIAPFSYKGIIITVIIIDELESYLADGWQVARNYKIVTVQNELLRVLSDLRQEYLNRVKAGNTVVINGIAYSWIAYGLSSTEDVIGFVRLFYLNGYSYEQIAQLYTGLTKSNKFNICLLNTINTIFEEGLNERVFRAARRDSARW